MSWMETPQMVGSGTLDDSSEFGGGMQMMDLGPPHVSFAGAIVLLLALKAFTESNLITSEPSEVRVSLLNIVNVGLQAATFIISMKLLAAWLINRGYKVPGFNELVGAL